MRARVSFYLLNKNNQNYREAFPGIVAQSENRIGILLFDQDFSYYCKASDPTKFCSRSAITI